MGDSDGKCGDMAAMFHGNCRNGVSDIFIDWVHLHDIFVDHECVRRVKQVMLKYSSYERKRERHKLVVVC